MRRRKLLTVFYLFAGGCLGIETKDADEETIGVRVEEQAGGTDADTQAPEPTETAGSQTDANTTNDRVTTRTGTPSPTPHETVTQPIVIEEHDIPDIKAAIIAEINGRRDTSLRHDTSLGEELDAMAESHSEHMAQERRVGSEIGDGSPGDRYESREMNCAVNLPGKIGNVDHDKLEVVAGVRIRGRTPEEVAETAANQWWDNEDDRWTLMLADAEYIGVGIVFADELAYITINLC